MNPTINKLKKIFSYSIGSVVAISLFATIFSLIKGNDLMKTVFNTNYIIGAIIIASGLFAHFVPIRLKKSERMVDHSNIADIIREEKDIKMDDAIVNIFWGICNIIIIGILEILVHN